MWILLLKSWVFLINGCTIPELKDADTLHEIDYTSAESTILSFVFFHMRFNPAWPESTVSIFQKPAKAITFFCVGCVIKLVYILAKAGWVCD